MNIVCECGHRYNAPDGVAFTCRTCGNRIVVLSNPAPQQALPEPTPATDEEKREYPGLIEMAAMFVAEWRAWRKAGKPVVTAEVRQQRRELCLACPKYDSDQDRCTQCGCYLYKIKVGGIVNADALSWATKSCPLDPPKWKAE